MCESAKFNKHCRANSARQIEDATRIALNTTSERRRIASLMCLSGVSFATATVFLHYTFDDQYPILAQTPLWSWGCEDIQINFDFWSAYVEASRALRTECRVTMHDLDNALRQFAIDERQPHGWQSKAAAGFH
jgi:hypothetical protein